MDCSEPVLVKPAQGSEIRGAGNVSNSQSEGFIRSNYFQWFMQSQLALNPSACWSSSILFLEEMKPAFFAKAIALTLYFLARVGHPLFEAFKLLGDSWNLLLPFRCMRATDNIINT